MFSRMTALIFLVLSSLSFLGCNLPLNELPPATEPIQVGLAQSTACLSGVVPVFETFFAGTASENDLNGMFDCMKTAVVTFEKSTQGRFEDRFTARELAHFVEQYFLQRGTRISDPLLVEVFRIKQLFVGGAIDSITRVEMNNTLSVIEEVRRISLNLNPYMKIYTFHWQTSRGIHMWDVDVKKFEEANMAVQQATKDLAVLIEKNGLPYHLPNALVLIRELSAFSASKWEWIAQVEKAMPLVEKLKQTLSGGAPEDVAPTEWRRFALLGARGYVQYLRYYYFIKEADLTAGGTQLVYFVRSVDDLFSYLGDMVDGKPGQILTRHEVLEILQAVSSFVPKVKISDDLLLEAMKIKVVFFGGRLDYFKKDDFERARAKLEAFRTLTEKFLSYSSVYSLNWKPGHLSPQEAQSYFKMSEANLIEFSKRLGENMENPYDLQDLIKLASEIDKLYFPLGPDGKPLAEAAVKFVPVLVSFKNILFSDQSSVIGKRIATAPQQWSLFLKTAGQLYSRYMYYNYFLKGHELTEEPGLSFFNRLTLDSSHFMDELIQQKPTQMVSFAELSQLYTALLQTGFLPQKISLGTLNGLTQVLVQKVLIPPEQRLAQQLPGGLTLTALDVLRNEFSMWVENQKFLGIVYEGVPENKGKSSSALIADLNSAASTEALNELKMIFIGPLPLSFDLVGRLFLGKPPLNYLHQTSNLINLVRTAVRVVIRSYAMNLSRITNYQGITSSEANSLFEDVKPLVADLGLLSSNSKGFAEARFRDANLFTPVANGDDLASFREMSNLFMMILSGVKIDSLMAEDLEKVCPITKKGPSKDTWTVKLDCLVGLYHEDMPRKFASMPDYIRFQGTLDSARFQAMFTGLLKASGAAIDGDGNVTVGDLILFPNIVQYVEGIYQVYDKDGNGELNTPESLAAYPIYKQILQQVSGLKDEQQLKGLFTWLLKYGKPPETLAEKIKFMTWWVPKGEQGWDVSASREMLAKILGFIADAISKPVPDGVLPLDLREIANGIPASSASAQ